MAQAPQNLYTNPANWSAPGQADFMKQFLALDAGRPEDPTNAPRTEYGTPNTQATGNWNTWSASPEGRKWAAMETQGQNAGWLPKNVDSGLLGGFKDAFLNPAVLAAAGAYAFAPSAGSTGFTPAQTASAAGSDAGTLPVAGSTGASAPTFSMLGPQAIDQSGNVIVDNSVVSGTGPIGTDAAVAGSSGSGLGGSSGDVATIFPGFNQAGAGPAGTGMVSAPSSFTGVNTAGLPADAIGSSGQFGQNLGPLGDTYEAGGGIIDPQTGAIVKSAPSVTDAGSITAKALPAPATANGGLFGTGISGKDVFRYGLPAAGLATQLLRRPGIPQEGQLNDRFSQMNAAGTADLNAARSGQISASQQAQIDTFKKNSQEQIKQYLTNSGQSVNSTAYLDMSAKVDEAALAMQQGFVDQLFNQGLSELGLADSAQSQLIQLRMQREQDVGNALNNFMFSLALMGGFK